MEPPEDQHSMRVAAGFCLPSQEYKTPPQLSFKLKEAGDVPKSTETWRDDHLPIDILLIAVGSCEFLSCFSLLDKPFKSYKKEIGYVYFGGMGDASDLQKLKIALMTCATGAASPGGSLTAVLNAVRVLRPKAVFLVGTCLSLGVEKVRMGDVVISSKLTAEGLRTPVSPLLCRLIQDAPYGWVAPLENPDELKVTVHCNGDILSQTHRENCRCDDICEQYPGAVAIEREGIGLYAGAYDANIEWVIVKGVASYFHQSQPSTSDWMSFASTMAASVVEKILNDPRVFLEWPHYNQDMLFSKEEKGKVPAGIKGTVKQAQGAAVWSLVRNPSQGITGGVQIQCTFQKLNGLEVGIGVGAVLRRYISVKDFVEAFKDKVLPAAFTLDIISEGSVYFTVRAETGLALKELYKRYCTYRLQRDLQELLVTDDITQLADGEVKVRVYIDKREFREVVDDLTNVDQEEPEPQPRQATSSVDPLLPRDATDINTPGHARKATVWSFARAVCQRMRGGVPIYCDFQNLIGLVVRVGIGVILYEYSIVGDFVEAFKDNVLPAALRLVRMSEGSVCFMVQAETSVALKELYERYSTDRLQRDLQKFLVTDEIRQLADGEVKLSVYIDEKEFKEALDDLRNVDEGEEVSDLREHHESHSLDDEISDLKEKRPPQESHILVEEVSDLREHQESHSLDDKISDLKEKRPPQESHTLVGSSDKDQTLLKERKTYSDQHKADEISDLKEKRPHQESHTSIANPERFVQYIKRNYKSAVLCPFPWCEDELQFKLADIFTRLQIVSKTRERSKLTGNVNMTDVFRPHAECENPRVVLVEGNPAMGKTTYCRKLAHDWSLSRIPSDSCFPKVEMLLLLKCRDINEEIANIQDAIDDQLLPVDVERSEKENFFSFIRNYQSRILLVLDGLDEVKNEDLLLPLIQGKVLSDIYLLLTARPEMGAKVRRYCDSLLQIVGYSEDDVISYIEQYFRNHSDPSLAKKLKDELAVNHELKELTSSPMNTALLCLLCEETNGIFPTKQTELYERLVSCAIRRYFAKRGVDLGEDDPSERCREQVNQLGKMAFEALLKNRLYFSEEEMRSENVLQLCFVTREPSRSKIKPSECYAFTHKTFQEYFAALYLANQVLTDSKGSEALLLNLSPMDNWQVWKFLFLLVAKKDGERAVFLVSCLGAVVSRHVIPEPKNDITEMSRFKTPLEIFSFSDDFDVRSELSATYLIIVHNVLDVIHELEDFHGVLNDCQRKMTVKLADCIPADEFELHSPTPRQLLFFLEYLRGSCTMRKLQLFEDGESSSQSLNIKALARALHTNCVLTHLYLYFSLHGDEIAVVLSDFLESNTTLTHLFLSLGDLIDPSGWSALARALTKNSTLKCLRLEFNSIMDSEALAFADALETNTTLTQLGLCVYSSSDLGIEAICKALQSNHVITHLSLSGSTIGDSGAEGLAGELQSPATQLSYVNLAHCEITSLGAEALAGALKTNRSLTYLSLEDSDISCSATALAEAIRLNRTLTHLNLSENDISDLGTEVICKALQSNHVMTHLILHGNTIGNSGAVALAEALKSPATQLSYLDLQRCHITTFGVEILAGALQTNRSLTHLNLAGLSISSSATALAEALQLNRTLTHLDLRHNQISDTEAIQLAQTLLDKNNTLAHLGLFDNNINAEGKAKLELVSEKRCFIRF
ncbi:NACHT, LRR and PYD domains-containing protein 5-like isoform X2 [Acropora muricata]|uniref:NACHT, LRR and PYD domains-containing protein 5-like isoform X2 n=1 Tax=Acropora muricata TaxID=159855 RepID=UPI0034E58F3D